MLQTVEFPTGVSYLASCLTDVYGNTLTHLKGLKVLDSGTVLARRGIEDPLAALDLN